MNPNIKKKQSNPQKIAVRFGKHLILKLSKKKNTIKLLLSAVLVGWLVELVGWLVGWLVGRVGWLLGFLSG